MPKYYVRDGNGHGDRMILIADNPLDACVKAVNQCFSSFIVGGWYWVSEQGFAPHLNDERIDSNKVNDILVKLWKDEENET